MTVLISIVLAVQFVTLGVVGLLCYRAEDASEHLDDVASDLTDTIVDTVYDHDEREFARLVELQGTLDEAVNDVIAMRDHFGIPPADEDESSTDGPAFSLASEDVED